MTQLAQILGQVLLVVALLASLAIGWVMTIAALPGTWVMVGVAALYVALMPADAWPTIGWPVVATLAGLALVGELIETAAGAAGAARHGASKRAAALSIVGAILGSIAGAVVGLPIPIVGSIVAAVLFAAIGAMLGAALGEEWKGRDTEQVWRVGQAAFWGRLWGLVGKIAIASAMVATTLAALVL